MTSPLAGYARVAGLAAAFLALLFSFTALACARPETHDMTTDPHAATDPPPAHDDGDRRDDALALAFDELVRTLRETEQEIRRSPSFGDEAERVGGYRHILRAIAKGLEAEVRQDPDHPYFRILDWWLREGGDNPDQRYAFSPIRGGEAYRIWGELGSATRVELQIYAGRPWDGTGSSAGYLAFEEIAVEEDGRFEILISRPEERGDAKNWLENPPEGTTVFLRHVYADWTDAPTGDAHIDRVGFEGRRRGAESEAELAARIRAAAVMFGTTARTWPAFVERRYVRAGAINRVTAPYDTYALGGARGRWMSGGYFELEPGEALVLRIPETSATYQAVQLTDMWFASLEHGNRISSLTTRQSVPGPDGAYWIVIANEDPGHANWLDAGPLRRGTFLLRWDGLPGELPPDRFPSSEVVPITALADHIPGFRAVEPAEREATRRARRRHLQLRSHR